ncbi:MAG: hypothetical protein PVF56_22850, partial [Desulfobacterales bacterium]
NYPNRITARICKPTAIRDYRINSFRGPRIDYFILTQKRDISPVLVFRGISKNRQHLVGQQLDWSTAE